MESFIYNFSPLSDTFSHGAYQTQNFNRPELRAPSVKGMIRWWHKALGYSEGDAQMLFGGINPTQAALVSVRVQSSTVPQTQSSSFMPHKGRGAGSMKSAIIPGCGYRLTLAPRRGGIDGRLSEQLHNSTKAWLLLGSIGQRSNRAAGSILWDQCPETLKGFEIEAGNLLVKSKVRFAILSMSFGSGSVSARDLAGRFPNTRDFTVPGNVFGSAKPRKPSPLKLKVVRLDDTLKLLAIWVPENPREDTASNLAQGLDLMDTIPGKQELAGLIREILPRLTG